MSAKSNHARRLAGLRRAVPALALLAVVAAVYGNSLGNGFHFDDWHAIEENPAIRSLHGIPRLFTDAHAFSIMRENSDLRPVLLTTFALNYALSGGDGWSYHLVNVLVHWGVVVLVFFVVRDRLWLGGEATAVAWTAAVLMAVHPLGTESVNYVSARSALLVTLCYVAAFDAAARGRRIRALVLAALAMLTKAIAVTLPVMVVAHALLGRARTRPAADGASAGRDGAFGTAAALAVVAVAGIAYRLIVLPASALVTTHDPQLTPRIYALTSTTAYLYYLRQFLWPDGLVVDRIDYPLVTSLAEPRAVGSVAALVVFSAVAWRARCASPALTFGWIWYVVTLLPEQSFFPLAEPVNDHRPYLAMPGLVAIAAITIQGALGRMVPSRALRRAVVAALAVALGTATVLRNRVWTDDHALWLDATVKAPANPRAWLNAGQSALGAGRLDEADRLLAEAHRLAPCYAFVQLNQSVLAARRGQLDESIALANEAIACRPDSALAPRYLGDALERAGRLDEALVAYRRALALDDRLADAWRGLARVCAARAEWREAAAAYDRLVALDPTDVAARVDAGVVHRLRLDDPRGAVGYFRAALALAPSHYGAQFQLALALFAAGDTVAARAEWRRFAALAHAAGSSEDLSLAPAGLREDAPP